MTIEIFKNYGCLAAEKRIVYTFGAEQPTAVCSDKIQVEIPEGWEIYKNTYGEIMVAAPWGWNYDINDVLGGNELPYFAALDQDGKMIKKELKVIE